MSFNKIILINYTTTRGIYKDHAIFHCGDLFTCNKFSSRNMKGNEIGILKNLLHTYCFYRNLNWFIKSINIEGRLRVEEWTDRDGKPRHTLEVHATDMQFIGGGARSDEAGAVPAKAAAATGEPASPAADLNDDDIPF